MHNTIFTKSQFIESTTPTSFPTEIVSRVQQFLENKEMRIICFGYSPATVSLLKSSLGSRVKGYCETIPTNQPKLIQSISTSDIRRTSDLVISCVVDGKPLSARRTLEQYSCDSIDFFSFSKIVLQETGEYISPHPFFDNLHDLLVTTFDELYYLYLDLQSKDDCETLIKIVKFRRGFNLDDYQFVFQMKNMYFENFLALDKIDRITFFDVGAHDGTNTTSLVQSYSKQFESAVLFEPSTKLAEHLKLDFSSPRYEVVCAAVGRSSGSAAFVEDIYVSTRSKTITNTEESRSVYGGGEREGNVKSVEVELISIDSYCAQTGKLPTFIKCDTEGSELEVLAGASNIIRKFKPLLAFSAYHHPLHLTQLYTRIKKLRPDYKFSIRHYTEGITETVLFAY